MKVLHLISSAGYYGAEAVVVNLSKALDALDTACTVGVFDNAHSSNMEVAEAAGREGLRVQRIPCKGRFDLDTIRQIRASVRQEKIDVLHAHGYKAQVYGCLAASQTASRLVATCHGYSSRFSNGVLPTVADLRQQAYGALDRVLLRRFDQVVATSSVLRDSLRRAGIENRKLTIIGNGVDCNGYDFALPSAELEQWKSGRLAIGLVARLTEGKGHSQLFEALPGILQRHPATVVFIVGEGPLRSGLEQSARKLGIERSVVFTGRRGDMPNVYAALDMVVLPSLFEGMPMVILEAMAAGCPVIASRVGAIPDVVCSERTGLLVEAGDVHGLSNAIERLIADPALRSSLAQQGQAFLRENGTAAAMAAKYLKVYQAAVAK